MRAAENPLGATVDPCSVIRGKEKEMKGFLERKLGVRRASDRLECSLDEQTTLVDANPRREQRKRAR
jgi:hypothetical protein